jgi:hypothetical protein
MGSDQRAGNPCRIASSTGPGQDAGNASRVAIVRGPYATRDPSAAAAGTQIVIEAGLALIRSPPTHLARIGHLHRSRQASYPVRTSESFAQDGLGHHV